MPAVVVFLYRWTIKAGLEQEFRHAWRELTRSIAEVHGSLGSRLHQTASGEWVAYAQWPSREHREQARLRGSANPSAAARMRQCIEREYDELELEVTDDLLVDRPAAER